MIFFAALLAILSVTLPPLRAGSAVVSVEAEGRAEAGSDAAAARQTAIARAKKNAVSAYITERVPPAILAEKKDKAGAIAGKAESYVVSYEIIDDGKIENTVVIKIRADLNEQKLGAAMRAAGLTPSKPLPRAFIMVECKVGSEVIESAWAKPKGVDRSPNPCEAAIGGELQKYGIKPIATGDLPPPDRAKILDPQDESDKKEVFFNLRETYQAGVMIVGKAIVAFDDVQAGSGKGSMILFIAAADVVKENVIFSDKLEQKVEIKTPADRDPMMNPLCVEAGARAAEEIYKAWQPKIESGEPRTINITISGISSYAAIRGFEGELKTQAPGVISAQLSSAGTGEVTYILVTKADAFTVADWLSSLQIEGKRLAVTDVQEEKIAAELK